jgi:hypothetical protein
MAARKDPRLEPVAMRVIAKTPVRHDGTDYPEGAAFEAGEAPAAALIAQGAAVPEAAPGAGE